MKVCSICREEKPYEEFHRWNVSRDGRRKQCKSCRSIQCSEVWHREKHNGLADKNVSYSLKSKYGITLTDYDKMFEDQSGLCAICHKPETTGKRLAVDHCHSSGKIRGLLCSNCNRGIGHLQDSVEILNSAIEYLRR